MSVPREPLSPIWLISGSNTVHPRNPNWLIHPAHVSLIHTSPTVQYPDLDTQQGLYSSCLIWTLCGFLELRSPEQISCDLKVFVAVAVHKVPFRMKVITQPCRLGFHVAKLMVPPSVQREQEKKTSFQGTAWQKCFLWAGIGVSGTLCHQKWPDLHRGKWVLFTCRQSSNAKGKQLWGRREFLYHKVLKTKLIGAERSYWGWPVDKVGLILRHPYRKRKGTWDHRGFCAFCWSHSTVWG